MIRIQNLDLPTTNVVKIEDKIIGITNDNNFEVRKFVIPRMYRGVDISDDKYVFLLQVKNSTNKPYLNLLQKNVLENEIELYWNIKRHDCVSGKIEVSIIIQKGEDEDNIVKQTYSMMFECINGINATENAENILPTVFEQAIIMAAAHAQNSSIEADRSKQYYEALQQIDLQNIMNEIQKIKEYVGMLIDPDIIEIIKSKVFEIQNANDINDIKEYIQNQIMELKTDDIDFEIDEVLYIEAINETENLNDGVDGNFIFNLKINKRNLSEIITDLFVTIKYAPFIW